MTEEHKRTVLITGCSDGGLGAALALAFHEAGFHVYATARDVAKMDGLCAAAARLRAPGIETLPLDVRSTASIAMCVGRVSQNRGRLDVLVNNAGAMMTMPVADVSIPEAKDIFDTNVWGVLEVTQAFLPLLLESARGAVSGSGGGVGPIVAVNTSVASTMPIPLYGVYSASKAAMAMFCDTMRIELKTFGVHVVELKTGAVGPTRLNTNNTTLAASRASSSSRSAVGDGGGSTPPPHLLPEKSIYVPAREVIESLMRDGLGGGMTTIPPAEWAKQVVQDLQTKRNKAPPARIWRGTGALVGWFVQFLPSILVEGWVKRKTKYTQVEEVLRLARIYPGNDVE